MAERRAGDLWSATDIGTPILGVNAGGVLTPLVISNTGSTDTADTNETATGAGGAATAITFAADADAAHVIRDIDYSYSAAPTGGGLTITDGGNTVFDIAITAAGPGSFRWQGGKRGRTNSAMVITLAAPGGAVVGKLNCSHYTVTVTAGSLDFSDPLNSGGMILFF